MPSAPRQIVWRGIRKDQSQDYPSDTEMVWWAFSSCTTSLSVRESGLYFGNLTIFTASPFYSTSLENPRDSGLLEIIGQPCYTSKLRYRSDYISKIKRRGVLHSTNNPNYQYPTIRIPRQYMIPTDEHYICISLVTVENETTKYRYIHPYELEDADNQGYHDRNHNSIWYSIQIGDIDGIK
ncbi:unnamed protein product, partial [Rotaria magnacalcarata]